MHQIKKLFISCMAAAFALSIGMPLAFAQKTAADPLQIVLVRAKVVVENGREVMQSAAIAKPDDVLEEVATYTNTSKSALKSVEATLPIPPNTELVMASVKPANAKASIDGKSFSKLPLTRKMRQPNGVEVEQSVPLSEYRYLRWYQGEFQPGKPMSFSARFRVANSPIVTGNAGK